MEIADLVGDVQDVGLADLFCDPANARAHDARNRASVVASLRAFGQVDPLVVLADPDDTHRHGRVIAGNCRLDAMRELGWETARVIWVRWSDAQATSFGIAHNRTAELATWEDDTLGTLLTSLEADPELFQVTGFTPDELAEIMAPPSTSDEESSGNDAEPGAPPAEPITQPGDLWTMGEHRLLCGDSTEPASYEALLQGEHADIVWTDPPYGVSYVGKTADALEIDNDDLSPDELSSFLAASLGAACEASEAGAAWFVAAPAGPLFMCFGAVLNGLGVWRQTLTWVKSTMVLGRSDFHYRHEPLFYGWKPGAAHHAPAERTHTSVLEFDKPSRNAEHPTMKPLGLVEYCVRVTSDPGSIVLDPFGGSGTTLIAADNLGRKGRLIELSPAYCDVIVRRWQEATGGKATRADGSGFA